MQPENTDIQSLSIKSITTEEIKWLKKIVKKIKNRLLTENNLIFLEKNNQSVYIHFNYTENKQPPIKFLCFLLIKPHLKKSATESEFHINSDLIYWYLDNIDDVLNYKDILNKIFITCFGEGSYSYNLKGYKLYHSHMNKHCKKWTPIEKILLLGFAIYLKLFKKTARKTLKRILKSL